MLNSQDFTHVFQRYNYKLILEDISGLRWFLLSKTQRKRGLNKSILLLSNEKFGSRQFKAGVVTQRLSRTIVLSSSLL